MSYKDFSSKFNAQHKESGVTFDVIQYSIVHCIRGRLTAELTDCCDLVCVKENGCVCVRVHVYMCALASM